MIYYTLYETKAAAMEAVEELRAGTRRDWDVEVAQESPVRPGFLSPCHRRTPAEMARWAEADKCGGAPVQHAGQDLAGVEVVRRGEFARPGERDAGRAQHRTGFAWPV